MTQGTAAPSMEGATYPRRMVLVNPTLRAFPEPESRVFMKPHSRTPVVVADAARMTRILSNLAQINTVGGFATGLSIEDEVVQSAAPADEETAADAGGTTDAGESADAGEGEVLASEAGQADATATAPAKTTTRKPRKAK